MSNNDAKNAIAPEVADFINNFAPPGLPSLATLMGPAKQLTPEEMGVKYVNMLMESCPFKCASSGAIGMFFFFCGLQGNTQVYGKPFTVS